MAVEKTPSSTLPGFTPPVVDPRPPSRQYRSALNPNNPDEVDDKDTDHLSPYEIWRRRQLLAAASAPKTVDHTPKADTVLASKKSMTISGEDNVTVYTLREPEKKEPSQTSPQQPQPQTVPAASGATTMAGPDNWSSVLKEHSDSGANFHNINAEFGRKAANTLTALDKDFKGQFAIISARRDENQQQALRNEYAIHDANHNVIGYTKPVGAVTGENRSEHLDGCALDVVFTGNPKDKERFYHAYHQLAQENGLQLVANDKEHMQLAHYEVLNIRRSEGTTQSASSAKPKPTTTDFAFHA